MARTHRKVIGINEKTGERREWGSTYRFGIEMGTSTQNVMQALSRNGVCCGWRLYDSPEYIEMKINELKEQLNKVR